jgi:hypothetical protein
MKLCHLNGCAQIVRFDSLEPVNLVIIFEPLTQLRRASVAKTVRRLADWRVGATENCTRSYRRPRTFVTFYIL